MGMGSDDEVGTRRISFGGSDAWRKSHGGPSRRWRLHLLNWVVRVLDVPALRPPPYPSGAESCATEARRLSELAAAGVHVPRVLERGTRHLVLSDIGSTLAARMRQSDPDEAAQWFSRAAISLGEAHGKGVCLGQPLARNLAIDADGRVGFLDFEEDPLQVMDLVDAQVRDWLLFVAGSVRHMPQDDAFIATLLVPPLAKLAPALRTRLRTTVARLQFLAVLRRLRGTRAAGLGKAVRALHHACADPRVDAGNGQRQR